MALSLRIPSIGMVMVLFVEIFLLSKIVEMGASIVVFVFLLGFAAVLTDGDLDALACERFAQGCALNYTGEFLGRVDLEGEGEGGCQDGGFALV